MVGTKENNIIISPRALMHVAQKDYEWKIAHGIIMDSNMILEN